MQKGTIKGAPNQEAPHMCSNHYYYLMVYFQESFTKHKNATFVNITTWLTMETLRLTQNKNA